MATEKQIEANRRNARRSTGPKSQQGKETVSRNAVKHGIYANNVLVLPEEESEYRRLADAIYEDFGGGTAFERVLVNKMISSIWRSTRADKIEAGLLADAILNEQRPGHPPDAIPASDGEPLSPEANPRALEFGRAYARKNGLISSLSRYRTRLDREFYKALDELRLAHYARVALMEPFVAANLKKFPVSPEEIKKRIGNA
jgi:hypothetical protein